MMTLLQFQEFAPDSPHRRCLLTLFNAGRRGIPAEACGYPRAGPWEVLLDLKRQDPPLAREVFRRGRHTPNHWVVLTDAGRELVDEYFQRQEARSG